jgi:hypothetical protein
MVGFCRAPRAGGGGVTLAPSALSFGRLGNAGPLLLDGWSEPEDGFTWSVGPLSRLRVGLPASDDPLWLEVAFNPFAVPGLFEGQDLSLAAEGVVIGQDHFDGEGTAAYPIPDRLRAGGAAEMILELRHPQARSPASLGLNDDARRLGFMLRRLRVLPRPPARRVDAVALPPCPLPASRDAMGQMVEALTGFVPRGLLLHFESLGRNCEFGLVQRHVGAEPLGLLRFAGITLDDLLHGLCHAFDGIGDDVVVRTHPTHDGREEFLVYDDRYRVGLHSFRTTEDATAAEVRDEHRQKLHFVRRQFVRCLKTGERIFVFQRPGVITRSQALPLLHALQAFGPNALLYVDMDPALPSGAVEQLGHRFFHGKLAGFAPAEDAGAADLSGWLSLCANAYRLWRATP